MLQPRYVRTSLEEFFQTTNEDFSDGKMGCAEETLEDILTYLHREYLSPNYLESYFLLQQCIDTDQEVDDKTKSDYQFHVNKDLDDQGCSPKCPSHLTFGLEFCEISACKNCGTADGVSQLKREFAHALYIEEIFSTVEIMQTLGIKEITLTSVIKAIIKGENEFHMNYQELTMCEKCKTPV